MTTRRRPGEIRDAIINHLKKQRGDSSVEELYVAVQKALPGEVAPSSVRSQLRLNKDIERTGPGRYRWIGR